MLQIISGKFFGDGEIVHNECNGILYSNVSFHAIHPIEYGNIKIKNSFGAFKYQNQKS